MEDAPSIHSWLIIISFPLISPVKHEMINPFVGMPAGGAVGVVLDANGNAEGALGPYEEEVRAAGDKAVPWQPTVGSVAWWISKHQYQ